MRFFFFFFPPSAWCEHHGGGSPYLGGSSSVLLSHRDSFWICLAVLAVGPSKFRGIFGAGVIFWIFGVTNPGHSPLAPSPLPCLGVHPGRISTGIAALGRNGHGQASSFLLKDPLGFGSMEFPVTCCEGRGGKKESRFGCEEIPAGWGTLGHLGVSPLPGIGRVLRFPITALPGKDKE